MKFMFAFRDEILLLHGSRDDISYSPRVYTMISMRLNIIAERERKTSDICSLIVLLFRAYEGIAKICSGNARVGDQFK